MDSEPCADGHMIIDGFDSQSDLNDRIIPLSSVTSTGVSGVAPTATICATPSTSTTISAIQTTSGAADTSPPGYLGWLDWQSISSTSSLMPPELTGTSLTDHLNADPVYGCLPGTTDSKVAITGLMRAELDQLYFDRVHPFCPIIHRRRYFASIAQDCHPMPAQACLRSAMRTLAAALSAPWFHLSKQLYTDTHVLLEMYSQAQTALRDKIQLEHIQSWLLLSHYELLHMGVHQAMLTAGRAFRLVQMAHLCDIDMSGDSQASPIASNSFQSGESFVDAEERRRTFWLAYSFDRFLCLRNEWPLTLQEETISTRLPAPESNFQNNRPIRLDFLSEVIAGTGPSKLSPFAECVVLATLQGRYFWIRHEWLCTTVEKWVKVLVSLPTVDSDPMLLFTHMLAHQAIVHLGYTVQCVLSRAVANEQRLQAIAYQRRSSQAVSEIIRLAKAVPYLSCFKAHPFLPDPLACAASFLATYSSTEEQPSENIEHLLRALGELQDTHCLAREHLQTLETRGKDKI
ncbi:hypothetical protein DV737_g3960, partial [Chaetothyriales sp. CBS 132003]